MRTGYRGDIFRLADGRLLGVSLGTDHCAEHEWGAKSLWEDFGVAAAIPLTSRDQVIGVKRRLITQLPDGLTLLTNLEPKLPVHNSKSKAKRRADAYQRGFPATWSALCYVPYGTPQTDYLQIYTDEAGNYPTIGGAWDECSFGFAADDAVVREIHAAFLDLNIMMMISASGPFGGGPGLSFAIRDRIPQHIWDAQEAADLETLKCAEYEALTRIKEKIQNSQHIKRDQWNSVPYYCLGAKKCSDGTFRWWLNPYNQRLYNFGWYTLQELEEWCEGKGPVVKTSEKEIR